MIDLEEKLRQPQSFQARSRSAGAASVPGQDKRIDVDVAVLFLRGLLKRRGDRAKNSTGELLLAALERDSVRPQEQAGLDVGCTYEIVDRIESFPNWHQLQGIQFYA